MDGIKCDIDVKQAFDCVRESAPPVRPAMAFAVKPDVAQKVIASLSDIQGRTDDSEIVRRPGASGGMQYALLDKRNGEPLAALHEQGGQYKMALYKTPHALAERIDSFFVSEKDISDFVRESRMPDQRMAMLEPD